MHVHKEEINHKKTISALSDCVALGTKERNEREKKREMWVESVTVLAGGGEGGLRLNIRGGIPPLQHARPLFVGPPSFVFEFKGLLLSNKYLQFASESAAAQSGRRRPLPHQ